MANAGMRREGDLKPVISQLSGMGVRLQMEVQQANMRLAQEVVARVKAGIRNQSYGHAQLNPKYAAWKAKKGYSTKVLIASGRYLESIKVVRDGDKWAAVVDPQATTKSGVAMDQLGIWLEYGTRIS